MLGSNFLDAGYNRRLSFLTVVLEQLVDLLDWDEWMAKSVFFFCSSPSDAAAARRHAGRSGERSDPAWTAARNRLFINLPKTIRSVFATGFSGA